MRLLFLLLFTFTSSTIFANDTFRSNFNGVDLTIVLIPSILVCFIILALNNAITALKKDTPIGTYYPRTITISNSNQSIELIFIKHPSQFFSWKNWNTYLNSKIGTQLNFLKRNM